MSDKYVLAFNKLKRNNPVFLAAVIANQAKKLDAAKEYLTKLEWAHDGNFDGEFCTDCGHPQHYGHKEDCELKALLDQLK